MARCSIVITSIVCATVLGAAAILSNAGPLDPPSGAVSSTYKTLTEVEPRIAINATNTPGDADSLFKITQPGSYYLTGDITGVSGRRGIEIASSNVTIDLRGFALQGVGGSLQGIASQGSGHAGIVIRNGLVTGWGASGIDLVVASNSSNSLVSEVILRGNTGYGIRTGLYSAVRGCIAAVNGQGGIAVSNGGTVEGCEAYGNTGTGIGAAFASSVLNCSVQNNGGDGITVGRGSSVAGCGAVSNGGAGFSTDISATFTGCSASNNTGAGFSAPFSCVITDCSAWSNLAPGFLAGSGVAITNCSAYQNTGSGISAGSKSGVRGCTAGENSGPGIVATDGSTVENCTVNDNSGAGINANNGCRIEGNMTRNNQQEGILVNFSCVVRDNNCNGDGAAAGLHGAIHVMGESNRIEGNHITYADVAMYLQAGGNTVVRNSLRGNTATLNTVGGNDLAPFTPASGAINPWANILN